MKSFPTLYKFSSKGAVQMWQIIATDQGTIDVTHGQKDGALQTTSTQCLPKNVGKKNETTPYQQACLEAESKWKKQIDKGYAENEPVERKTTAPMLAHSYDDHAHTVTYPCYFQPKLDGVRCIAEMADDRTVTLWSRQGKIYDAVPHVNEILKDIMTPGEILDGELYCHGANLQTLISWVKKAQPESQKVQYHVYDMVSDHPFSKRLERIQHLITKDGSVTRTVFTDKIHSADEIPEKHGLVVEQGYEGIMLRVGKCEYRCGYRSRELLKVKAFKDAEFEIVGAEEGKGKSVGQATFICKTATGQTFNARPRGEDSLRKAYWQDRDSYVGRKLTVRYFDLTNDGIPRFPVGIAVREDI